MIKTWQHKGLKNFFETGVASKIQPSHKKRLKLILQRLNAAVQAEDLELPGMRFHRLTGDMKGCFSITVNENWRVIYKFENNDAILVDYLDSH